MSKGSSFESFIAKKLSLWISNNNSDDILERNLGSGSRQTIKIKKNEDIKSCTGDLSFSCKEGVEFCELFSVECKHYKEINLWSLITSSKGGLPQFWIQCKRDASYNNRYPILICRQNWRPILLITVKEISNIFKQYNIHEKIISDDMNIFLFEDILKINFEDFIKQVKRIKG